MTRMGCIWGLAGLFGHVLIATLFATKLTSTSLNTATSQNFNKLTHPIECGRDGEPAVFASPCIQLWGEASAGIRRPNALVWNGETPPAAGALSLDKSVSSQQQVNAEQEAVIIIELPPDQKTSVSTTNSSNSRHDLGTYSPRVVETEQEMLGPITDGERYPFWTNRTPIGSMIPRGKRLHDNSVFFMTVSNHGRQSESLIDTLLHWILDVLLSPDSQLVAALCNWRQLEMIRVISAGFWRNQIL